MGWSITIQTDRGIDDDVIDDIVKKLPESLSRGMGKQHWGWSLAVDVEIKDSYTLRLSGSWSQSGNIAELACEIFKLHLMLDGYDVEIMEMA